MSNINHLNSFNLASRIKNLVFFKVFLVFIIIVSFSIDAFSQLSATFTNQKDACDGLNNGSIDVTVTNSSGPITVQFFGPPNFLLTPTDGVTETVSGMTAKSYPVIVQDDNESVVYNVDIFNITPDLNASLNSTTDNSDCNTPNGSIEIDVVGGTGTYSYSWTGPNGFISATQDISGLEGGDYSVTVFDDGTNCSRNLGIFTLANPALDASLAVTAAADPICEGDNTTIDVALSEVGVNYQLRNNAGDVNIGTPVAGTGATINLPTGVLAATTTFNVLATSGVCPPVELTTLVTVTVDPSPNTGLTVTAATNPICETGSTTIDVALSETGYSYQLRNDAGDINIGAPVVGNGGTINLPTGVLLVTTTFNILVTSGVCTPVELTTLVTVNVDAVPNAGLAVTAATDPICEGGNTTIDVALSEVGVSYQLRNDAGDINIGTPVVGNGGTINLPTGVLLATTTFNVLTTSGVCTPVELTITVIVNVDAAPNTGLAVTAAVDPICEGDNTTIDVALSENGYSYQLRNDAGDINIGTPVVGTGGTINLPTGALLTTTTFNVLVISGTCSIELTTLVTVNVDAAPNTGLTVTAAANPICEGDNTTIDVALSETGYSYQLRNDAGDINIGTPVAGTGATINLPTGVLAATTTFNVLVTNGTCSVELTTTITVNIDAAPNTGLTVTAATNPICGTGSTTIDVALSENGYSYQLRNDAGNINIGTPVVGNGGTINLPTGVLLATTTFNILVTSGVCTPVELTTTVTVNVDAVPNAGLAVTAATDPICEGGNTTIDVALSEVGVSYQLRNDAGDINIGTPVVGTGGTINLPTGTLLATTTFNVLATSGVCTPVELATTVTVNVDAAPNTGLTVTAAADPVCETGSTTIDVALSEVGVSYQLRNDAGDVNIGTPVVGTGGTINLPTGVLLTTTTFNVLVISGTCSIELTTLVTVNVDAAPNTGLTVTAATDPICEGDNTTIDVALSENGYNYQLRNDAGDINIGTPVVGNGGTISLPTGVLLATTTFNVLVTNGTCSIELATTVTVNVDAAPNTGLAVTAATDPICEGDNTTIDVALSENGYNYQLRNDAGDINIGTPVVGTGGTINLPTGALLATTTFNVLVISGTCSIELTTTVTVNVDTAPNTGLTVTAATDPICEGDNTTIDVALSENGYNYQLRNDAGDINIGTPVVGNGGTISLPTGVLLATTTFNVLVTNGTCSIELATTVTVNVDAAPNTGLAVTAATDPICEGDNTTIDVALSENGYNYQLRNDAGDINIGTPVVGTGGTINLPTGALLATTTFNVLVISGTCSIELTTTVTVNVDAAPNTGLTVTAATDSICEGDNTTIDVALSEVGVSYQLRNDAGDINIGTPVVGNGGTINLPTGVLLATTTFNVLVISGTCSIELATTVTVNVTAAPDGTISGNIAVCENTSGEVYSVPDAGAGATYAWTVTGGTPVLGAATNSFTVDWATNGGVVEVTITGPAPANCVTVSNITVAVSATSPPPNGGNNMVENYCQDSALPSLDANTTGTVAWYSDAALTTQIGTGNPFTPSATNLDMTSVGTTTFYVTQDVGCAVSTAIEYAVTIIANPDGTITGNNSICENTSGEVYTVPLDAGATYAWTLAGGDGSIVAGASTNSVTVDWLATGGDLQVTITGAAPSSCVTVSNMAVTIATQPIDQSIVEADQSICENASVSISLASSENGVLYELFLNGSPTGVSATGDGTANFIIGALNSATGLVPAGSPHTIEVQASIGGGCVTMLTDNVLVDVTANPQEQTIIEAGNVTICEANGQIVTLANSETGVNYEVILNGGVTSISAVGTGNANFVVGTLTVAQGLTIGNHIITVQATQSGCTLLFSDQIDVTVQNVSAPPTGASPVTECQNGAAPALVVTGTNINWYDDAAQSNPPIATGSPFTPTAAQLDMTVTGTTSFFVTQDEGCGESAVLEIQVIVENCSGCYTVDLNLSNATCTDDDGEITLVVGANGVSPFDFEITNTATGNSVSQDGQPNTTFTFSGVASGNYTYLVRDATACEVTGSLDIGIDEFKVIATVTKAGDIACFGDPTGGTARISVVGGVNPYQYNVPILGNVWISFASGDIIEGLPVGADYSILVRDDSSDGCPHSSTISISEPAAIEATANKLSDTYPEQDVGSFEVVDIASDFPPFEIMLLDGNGDIIIDFLPIVPDRFGNYRYVFDQLTLGAYTAVVKDATGCEVPVNEIIIESKTDVIIPNVFTPNNDGYNEAFIILNKKADTKLIIVNRWGVKVFDDTDYQNDWKAEGVPDGIYFYTISMDGQIYNGSVEVWRGGAKINN